jgi:hypothetical protein
MRFTHNPRVAVRNTIGNYPTMDSAPRYRVTHTGGTAWYEDLDPYVTDTGVDVYDTGGSYGRLYGAGRLF